MNIPSSRAKYLPYSQNPGKYNLQVSQSCNASGRRCNKIVEGQYNDLSVGLQIFKNKICVLKLKLRPLRSDFEVVILCKQSTRSELSRVTEKEKDLLRKIKLSKMSRICQITGKKVMVGNNVSHSKRSTKRTFEPNLFKKKFYMPEEDRWVQLKVSASGIRYINKVGLLKALKCAVEKGFIKSY